MALINISAQSFSKPRRRTASPKSQIPIFQRYKANALDAIRQSVNDAEGRFGGGGREAIPLNPPMPSKNWRVDRSGYDSAGEDQDYEMVWVYLKCGSKKLEVFEDDGKPTNETLIKSDELIPTLNEMSEQVRGMEKDSELGKAFHTVAIKQAKSKRKADAEKAYNTTTDLYQ